MSILRMCCENLLRGGVASHIFSLSWATEPHMCIELVTVPFYTGVCDAALVLVCFMILKSGSKRCCDGCRRLKQRFAFEFVFWGPFSGLISRGARAHTHCQCSPFWHHFLAWISAPTLGSRLVPILGARLLVLAERMVCACLCVCWETVASA